MHRQKETMMNKRRQLRKTAGATVIALMLLGVFLSIAATAGAAGPKGMGMRWSPEEKEAVLAYRLQLTEIQKDTFHTIMSENITQRRALWEKHRAEVEAARQKHRGEMEALDNDLEARLANVLTDDQMAEFRKIRAERNRRRGERREHRRDFGNRPF